MVVLGSGFTFVNGPKWRLNVDKDLKRPLGSGSDKRNDERKNGIENHPNVVNNLTRNQASRSEWSVGPAGVSSTGNNITSQVDLDETDNQVQDQVGVSTIGGSLATTQEFVLNLGLDNEPNIHAGNKDQHQLQSEESKGVSSHVGVGKHHKDETEPGSKDNHDGEEDLEDGVVTSGHPSLLPVNGDVHKVSNKVDQKGVLEEWVVRGGNLTRRRIIPVGANLLTKHEKIERIRK